MRQPEWAKPLAAPFPGPPPPPPARPGSRDGPVVGDHMPPNKLALKGASAVGQLEAWFNGLPVVKQVGAGLWVGLQGACTAGQAALGQAKGCGAARPGSAGSALAWSPGCGAASV